MVKVRAVIGKEWAELRRNRVALSVVTLLPTLFVLLPLLVIVFGAQVASPSEVAELCRLQPQLAAHSDAELFATFVANQFLLLFLVMPLAVPMTIAAHSIVGEKQGRSLEPLLATPITTSELLLGKGVAAALPGVAATWLAYAVFLGLGGLLSGGLLLRVLLDPTWLVGIFLLAPLLAGLAVGIGLIISSRVNDARLAEQLGMLVALPLFALLVGQAVGLVRLGPLVLLGLAAVALVANLLVLRIAVRLFERETILTRWG